MECSCCGQNQRAVTPLDCRPEVGICRDCIGGLAEKAGLLDVTATLPVVDMAAAISFYESIGFEVQPYGDGEGFAFVHREGQSVFDLDQVDIDPATNGAGCYIIVPDVDVWRERIVAAGVAATEVTDMPWGMREFSLRDPSGNRLRIGRSSG